MLLESACIPIPSEATMLFAGFNVANGEYSLFAAVAAGVLGNLVGSWIAYGVGYYGRVEWLEKHGRKLHIKPEHLAWADRWFERWGAPRSSSRASCRSSARSSRCRRVSLACRSGASRS